MSQQNQKRKLAAIAAMNADKSVSAEAQVIHLSMGDRAAGAAKILGAWLAGGVVCIFVPILHFFLVPASILIGIALSIRQLKLEYRLADVSLNCPECGKAVTVDSKSFEWPKRVPCGSCQKMILIRELE